MGSRLVIVDRKKRICGIHSGVSTMTGFVTHKDCDNTIKIDIMDKEIVAITTKRPLIDGENFNKIIKKYLEDAISVLDKIRK